MKVGRLMATASGLIAITMSLGAPLTAHATTVSWSDTIVFHGNTGNTLTCPSEDPTDPAVGEDNTDGCLDLVGGAGTFTFNAPAGGGDDHIPGLCTSVSENEENPASPQVGACGIAINNGAYTNIVCGTGTASGTASVAEVGDPNLNLGFLVVFSGGVGVAVAGLPQTPPQDFSDGESPSGVHEIAVGAVVLTGIIGADDVVQSVHELTSAEGECVDGFGATGVLFAFDTDLV
jgi:hypothetical protein